MGRATDAMKRPPTAFLAAATAFLSSVISAMAMSTAPTRSCRVAVLGSGIAGSTVARKLAEAGMKVSVFECGFGIGGRTSTRVTRDEHKFAFDHGAQYIGQPKTSTFKQGLAAWQAAGFVKEWTGRVADVSASGIINQENDEGKRRYVGYPAMNSICTNLLQHDNINVVLETRACATYNDDNCQWTLTSHGDKRELGQYDWLIGGDRLSATNNRADLRHAPLPDFKEEVEKIASVPILVLMVAFESSSLEIPYDGITFDEERGEFGSLGWIARDTSKPGRERNDGKECWVVQSGPKAAKMVLESVIEEKGFEKKRALVRQKAKAVLLEDFLAAIPKLYASDDTHIPPIASAVGHRWSAAFPSVPESSKNNECFVDIEHRFIGCGDYMGKLVGRVEGAYLSGTAAASALLNAAQAK